MYWIKDIDFSITPESTFNQTIIDLETKRKKSIKKTYSEYLNEKYCKTISDKDQPILMTNTGIGLVPEFCIITDLSDEILSSSFKFNLIREVINATKPDI